MRVAELIKNWHVVISYALLGILFALYLLNLVSVMLYERRKNARR